MQDFQDLGKAGQVILVVFVVFCLVVAAFNSGADFNGLVGRFGG
jgi:hypothetical protein